MLRIRNGPTGLSYMLRSRIVFVVSEICVSVVGKELPQTMERAYHLRYDSLTNGHFIYVTAHVHRIWPPCTYELDHMVLSMIKEPHHNLKMSRVSFKKRELGINNGA